MILCRRGNAEAALHYLRKIMGKLKLTVNEEKTRICKVPEGEFDFLGFTFGRMYSRTTGQARLALRPSKKSIKRMVEKVHALTVRSRTWQETTAMISELNRALAGWANYFSVGSSARAYPPWGFLPLLGDCGPCSREKTCADQKTERDAQSTQHSGPEPAVLNSADV